MTFNVQNIVSSLNKQGVAKTSHFEVQLTSPFDTGAERDMMYRADAAELPGRTITTVDGYKPGNIGPITKIAYGQMYGDTTVTFLLSEDMREKEYFELWQNLMVTTGAFEEQGGRSGYANSNFKPNYYDNYVGSMVIRQYGSGGELRTIHTFNEVMPTIIQPIQMNWNEDSLARLTVTFAYRNYKVAFNKSQQPRFGSKFGFSIGPNGVAISGSIPGIGNVSANKNGVTGNIGGFNLTNLQAKGGVASAIASRIFK
jgi:hypothetical protein